MRGNEEAVTISVDLLYIIAAPVLLSCRWL
jgi:hypothetical protein